MLLKAHPMVAQGDQLRKSPGALGARAAPSNVQEFLPREPGANFLEGVENDLRSTENSQNESHLLGKFQLVAPHGF